MISLYDRVKIKSNGITGIVVDISVRKGITWYIVESDSKYPLGDSKGYGDIWPEYTCKRDEIAKKVNNEYDRFIVQPGEYLRLIGDKYCVELYDLKNYQDCSEEEILKLIENGTIKARLKDDLINK